MTSIDPKYCLHSSWQYSQDGCKHCNDCGKDLDKLE